MEQDKLTQQQKIAQNNAVNVSVPDFLLKTYQMLEDTKHSSYVSWSKDGTMIIIKKPLAFAEEILPVFFKHSNLSSFIRQLNNYSFRKMKSKEYEYCFYHEMFRRDRRDLLKHIKRKKVTRPKSQKHAARQASKKPQIQPSSAETPDQNPVKKIHTEDNNTMKAFQDNQIIYLRRANQQLREELIKTQAQDRSLRHVISLLSNYYGAENIQNIIKMSDVPKEQSIQGQANGQINAANDIQKFSPLSQQPNGQTFQRSSFDGGQTLAPNQAQTFIDYAIDPLSTLPQPENAFQFGANLGEGMDTADNLSVSPRIPEEQHINYKNIMDQPITEINTKQEPDFFRNDSTSPSFPFPSRSHAF